MQELYYTPTPEDFRCGFEFEMLYLYGGWGKEVFNHKTLRSYKSIDDLNNKLDGQEWEDHIRVSYLTAEQIELEGWEGNRFGSFSKESNGFIYRFSFYCEATAALEPHIQKGVIINRFNPSDWIVPNFQVYRGSCRCINDLRLICKLLNISK